MVYQDDEGEEQCKKDCKDDYKDCEVCVFVFAYHFARINRSIMEQLFPYIFESFDYNRNVAKRMNRVVIKTLRKILVVLRMSKSLRYEYEIILS